MKTRTIALTTSALVAVAAFATTASAGGTYSGKLNLGFENAWESYENNKDIDYTALRGSASVNVPYDQFVNLQFDIFGNASMDNIVALDADGGSDSFYGGFGAGAHINYRDEQGALGVFAAVGRADIGSGYQNDAVVYAAGFEGQYYCNLWTLRAQVGYMDSDDSGYQVQEAGFIRAGASYYASSKLKLAADLGYLDGRASSDATGYDVTTWDWSLSAEYMFGKSVPVSTYIEYRGQSSEAWSYFNVDRDAVNVGVRFYFGGDGDLMKADRDGAAMSSPDILTNSRYY